MIADYPKNVVNVVVESYHYNNSISQPGHIMATNQVLSLNSAFFNSFFLFVSQCLQTNILLSIDNVF